MLTEDRESRKARQYWERMQEQERCAQAKRHKQAMRAARDSSLTAGASLPASPSSFSPSQSSASAAESTAAVLSAAVAHEAALALIPACPVLTPSLSEFQHPMRFIRHSVSQYAQYGVVLIRPPAGWQPAYRYELDADGVVFPCKKQVMKRYSQTERDAAADLQREQGTAAGGAPMVKAQTEEAGEGGAAVQAVTAGLTRIALQVSAFKYAAGMTMRQFREEEAAKAAEWRQQQRRWRRQQPPSSSSASLQSSDPHVAAESAYWRWAMFYGKNSPAVYYANDVDAEPHMRQQMPPAAASLPPSVSSSSSRFHAWDLSVLNSLPSGLLHYLDRCIPGVTAPMLYIGMQFSTFCWHHEDHHLYSVSYNHAGRPKTWYAVPGSHCEAVQQLAKDELYPFFDHERDAVLARKTSMFSPVLLAAAAIPCYRAVQEEGMLVITFPRAYHSGFSHGFSLAESVNFAVDDWLEAGYEATAALRKVNRFPVVPYAELVVRAVEGVIDRREQSRAAGAEREAGVEHEDVEEENGSNVQLLRRLELCFFRLVLDELRDRHRLYGAELNPKLQLLQITAGRRRTRYCRLCQHASFFSRLRCPCPGSGCLCLSHALCRSHKQDTKLLLSFTSMELINALSELQQRMQTVKETQRLQQSQQRQGQQAETGETEEERGGREEDEAEAKERNDRFDMCLALATALSDRESSAVELSESSAMDNDDEADRGARSRQARRQMSGGGAAAKHARMTAAAATAMSALPIQGMQKKEETVASQPQSSSAQQEELSKIDAALHP